MDKTVDGVRVRGYVHKIHVHPPHGEQPRWVATSKSMECADGYGETRESAVADLMAKMREKINSFVGARDPKTNHLTPMPVPSASISVIRTPGSEDTQVIITDALPPYEPQKAKAP